MPPDPTEHAPETRTGLGIVTICGSLRFADLILAAAVSEWQSGNRVYAPTRQPDISREEHDRRHRGQILASTEILVVSDDTGYIGEHTRGEIEFARQHSIPVRYWTRGATQ
jgi:hypothetical protein